MPPRMVGTVLADRTLIVEDGSGRRMVRVLIGSPGPIPGSTDCFCPYQILGLTDDAVRYAEGVDGAQALYLALEAIGTELLATPQARAGQLRWRGKRTLGFPSREQRVKLHLVSSDSGVSTVPRGQ
jgi:hypothetical protein